MYFLLPCLITRGWPLETEPMVTSIKICSSGCRGCTAAATSGAEASSEWQDDGAWAEDGDVINLEMGSLWCHQTWQWKIPYEWRFCEENHLSNPINGSFHKWSTSKWIACLMINSQCPMINIFFFLIFLCTNPISLPMFDKWISFVVRIFLCQCSIPKAYCEFSLGGLLK